MFRSFYQVLHPRRTPVPRSVLKSPQRSVIHPCQFSTSPRTLSIFQSPLLIPKVPHLIPFTDFLLDDALDRHKEIALVNADTGESLTYGKFREKVNDLAIQFYIRGWEQGQTLAVVMTNKTVYPLTVLAAAKIGIKVTLVNPTYKSRMMVKQLKNTKTEYIITTKELLHYVRDACQSLRNIKEILVLDRDEDKEKDKRDYRLSLEMKYNLLLGKPPGWGALPEWVVKEDEVMFVPHTDEGRKGVPLTQAAMTKNLLQVLSVESDIGPKDVFLVGLPYHDLYNLILSGTLPLLQGAKMVLLEKYDFKRFLEVVQEHKISYAHVPPQTIKELAQSELVRDYDLSSLRVLLLTEAVEEGDIDKVEKKLKTVKIKQGYSMTDLTPPVMLSPTNKIKKGSVGILLPNTQAKVIDPTTKTELGVDQEGDLYIKGDQIMTSWLNKPEETAKDTDTDGFFRTGDLAKVDAEGYWWVNKRPVVEEDE